MGDAANKTYPTLVTKMYGEGTFANALRVSNGSVTTGNFIVDENGDIWATGNNGSGKLGDETVADKTNFTKISESNLKLNIGTAFRTKVGISTDITASIENYLNLLNDTLPAGNLTYTSLDESVFTVSSSGKLTAVSLGESYLIVKDTANNLSALVSVQVTNNNANSKAVPTVISGMSHTLALKEDGTVWAWGDNEFGQLGNNSTINSNSPVQVRDVLGTGYLTDIIKISAGYDTNIALSSDGKVYAWGNNNYGQIGDSTTAAKLLPVEVIGLPIIKDIGLNGNTSLAITEDGDVYAWGRNTNGSIGDGTTTQRTTPVKMLGRAANVVKAAAGELTTYLLKSNGTVWGTGLNTSGQLGQGNAANTSYLEQVLETTTKRLEQITDISAGANFLLMLKEDKTAYGTGLNTSGQLGDASTANRNLPVAVKAVGSTSALTNIKKVVAGSENSIAVTEDNKVYTWGKNNLLQLANGNTTNTNRPVEVTDNTEDKITSGIKNITKIWEHISVVANNGEVWSWGKNDYNQIGSNIVQGTNADTPYKAGDSLITSKNTVIMATNSTESVEIEYDTYFNLLNNNTVPNINLSVENGNTNIATATVNNNAVNITSNNIGETTIKATDSISGLSKTITVKVTDFINQAAEPQIAGAIDHTLILKQDGTLWAYGKNNYGQLRNWNNRRFGRTC